MRLSFLLLCVSVLFCSACSQDVSTEGASREEGTGSERETPPNDEDAPSGDTEDETTVADDSQPGSDESEDSDMPDEAAFPQTLTADAAYYETGPQQGSPADGELERGTRVRLVEEAGSYVRVETADGLVAFVSAEAVGKPAGEETPVVDVPAAVVAGNNALAWDLYGQLRGGEGNLFFSPASISTALAMTYAGARGETEQEMAQALHFALPQDRLHGAYGKLLKALAAEKEGYRLRIANRLWGQQGREFLAPFIGITRDEYDAELAQVDFVNATEQTRQTINGWVSEQTEEKIPELIPQGALDAMTRLVLTNAIYFKGDWAEQFDEKRTRPAEFHLGSGETVKVPTMSHHEKSFPYAEVEGLQVLKLPYEGDELSMLVLLPRQKDGLPELEQKLSAENVAKWTEALKKRDVDVWLPKFETRSKFVLNEALKSLGMKLAFAPGKADFSGMDGTMELYVSDAIHEAYVKVNEEGTEAAAATGIVVKATSVQILPEFRADHPFVFCIRDERTGALLFVGRVVDPRE